VDRAPARAQHLDQQLFGQASVIAYSHIYVITIAEHPPARGKPSAGGSHEIME
jgi:hypothetical protein